MKFVLYALPGAPADQRVGMLRDAETLVHLPLDVPDHFSGQAKMQTVIDSYEDRKQQFLEMLRAGSGQRLHDVALLAPLPRPGKILCCIANYWEHAQREPRPLNMFLKNPDAVVGPDQTILLPEHTEPWVFMHEAELGIVVKGPAKRVSRANWRDAVFGYTCFIDVSARGEGRYTWKQGSWIGKSFDTFAPIGPCIVTADEIADPNDMVVRFWNDGQLRHHYSTDDMEHRVPELIEFATSIMTLNSGDVIACGTNHEGLGALQHGERVEIEIECIGRMALDVEDPLRRSWERGVYMGRDSTNHEAVRRHKPDEAHLLK